MGTQWTHDGVVLELPDREGPLARARLAWAAVGTAVLLALVGVGSSFRPAPAPVCVTAALCKAHLPPEVNPDPPDLDSWVAHRVAEVLDEVRTEDRLPSDIAVVDHLSLAEPGNVEWAFLEGEHLEPSVMAESTPDGLSQRLRTALDRYRVASGEGRVHFQDNTRFVAEIQAVRAAVDRQEARARLDALAARNRSVLDLGTAPARELVSAATAVARAEWTARRHLEDTRLSQVTADLVQRSTRAEVAWLFAMVLGFVSLAGSAIGTLLLARRARRTRDPVCIAVNAKGIRIDGRWFERASIVWVGTRRGALRVVTRDDDHTSRRVEDDRALHAALKQWRRLSEPDGEADPDGERRVRQLLG